MNDKSDPQTKEEVITEYHRLILMKVLLFVFSIAGIILVVGLFSISVFDSISLLESYEVIWNHIMGNSYEPRTMMWWADRYIWNTALPRTCAAIIAGVSLAVCGTLMQAVMNNPLADPYSTGISSGACLGAVSAIVVGSLFSATVGEFSIVTNAFIGAIIPALLIIILSERIRMTPATLILIGTALSYFFNSMITYLMVTTDADTLKSAYLWQIGHLDKIMWSDIPLMLIITILGSIFILMISKKLNIMSLGERSATSLGINVQSFRILCLSVMAIMTAAIISFTGIIGFVGLVAPHIVRLIIGSDNKYVIPISMTFGALLLLVADYVSSLWSSMPVGVVMSIIGSPLFFALIVFQSKRTGAIY